MSKKISIIIILLLFFCIFVFFLWQGIYLPKNPFGEKVLFEIKKGQGGKEIAKNLKNQGLIKNATLFRIYTFFKGTSRKLKAGYYSISPAMTIPQIAEKFFLGNVAKIKITIPEGFALKEIQKKLEEFNLIKRELPFFKVKDFKNEFDFLKGAPDEANLEGFLFPDTYQLHYGVSEKEIIKKMLENFGKKLNSNLRAEIERQGKSIFQTTIMASMIEKEVRDFEEKKLVSGILWKRLENGIPLQVDATITYITGKKTIEIPLEDLQIDSPYNTYKYKGLPIGPICNPGFDSILAAVYPKDSEFWYYLSMPDGKTIFSKTLQEHNLAKAKYLK